MIPPTRGVRKGKSIIFRAHPTRMQRTGPARSSPDVAVYNARIAAEKRLHQALQTTVHDTGANSICTVVYTQQDQTHKLKISICTVITTQSNSIAINTTNTTQSTTVVCSISTTHP
jgi:hypothetical protein